MNEKFVLTRDLNGVYAIWEYNGRHPTLVCDEWECSQLYPPNDRGTLEEMSIYIGSELPELHKGQSVMLRVKTIVEIGEENG